MDTTKLVPANLSTSLRTTVPRSIVKQLGLEVGGSLDWEMDKDGRGWFVTVRKSAKA